MGLEVPLPYQPPRWLTSERIAAAAAAVAVATVSLQIMPRVDWPPRIVLTLIGELVVLMAARLVTRDGTTVSDAVAGAFTWIPVCSAAGAGLLLFAGLAIGGGPDSLLTALAGMIPAAMFGIIASVPLLIVGLPLALVAATGRGRPSHEAPVRALVNAGVWLLVVTALPVAVCDSVSPWSLAPGALMILAGAGWTALRGRFVRRVRAGQEPPYVIVGLEGGRPRSGEGGLLPYRPLRRSSAVDLLAVVVPPSGAAYRATDQPVPLCLVARRT